MQVIRLEADAAGSCDLRELRHTAGLSQQEVAQRADCSLATVALFEQGYRPSRSAVLPRIVEVLHNACTEAERRSAA